MRKNMIRLLALTLCMVFAFPAALAESYDPGSIWRGLFADAFLGGKIITAGLNIDVDAAEYGLTEGMTQEEAAQVQALFDVLDDATVTVGAGLIEDGLRVIVEGDLADGGNAVDVEAALDVTLDGLALESDLFEGKRVSAKWETILALAGMSEEDIAVFTTIKEMDPAEIEEALIAALEEIGPMLEEAAAAAAEIAAPYIQTVVTYAEGLPIDVQENLEREDYPFTALEVGVTVSVNDLGTLINLLCDQLEKDETLLALIDAGLAQTGEDMTSADLIAAIRSEASYMNDTTPYTFYLGMDENGMPLYAEVYAENAYGDVLYGGIFGYEDAELGNVLDMSIGVYDADGVPQQMIILIANCLSDPQAGTGAGFEFYVVEGEETIVAYVDGQFAAYSDADQGDVFELSVSGGEDPELPMATIALGGNYLAGETDPEGEAGFYIYALEGEDPMASIEGKFASYADKASALGAMDTQIAFGIAYNDGYEEGQMVMITESRSEKTAAGGEKVTSTSAVDVYVGESQISEKTTSEIMIEPTADGGLTGYERASDNGYAVSAVYATRNYDAAASAALEQITLETVSEAEMDALINEVSAVLMEEKLPALMQILPQEVIELLETM